MFEKGKFHILLDGGHGSSGKGAAITRLVDRFGIENVSSNNMPNAGHTVYYEGGAPMVFKALPAAASLRKQKGRNVSAWVGPNSSFDLEQFRKELGYIDSAGDLDLLVHPRAALLNQEHIDMESPNGILSTLSISSTMSGAGASYAMKAMRRLDTQYAFENSDVGRFCRTPVRFWGEMQRRLSIGQSFMHEVSQGFALSLDWGTHARQCLNKSAKVLFTDGTVRTIKEVVENQIEGAVWSVNDRGEIEPKLITGYVKNAYDGPWYYLSTELSAPTPLGGVYGAKYTSNHTIETQRGKVRVDELQVGDRVRSREAQITGAALQVLLGGILGDGTLARGLKRKKRLTAQYQETHSVKQEAYLLAKASILQTVIGGKVEPRKRVADKGYLVKNSLPQVRYNSAPKFSLYKLAEKYAALGAKSLNVTALVQDLDWLGLAIWYQDDGELKTVKRAKDTAHEVIFHTQGFDLEVVTELAQRLSEKFGIDFKLRSRPSQGKQYWQVALGAPATRVFLERVRGFIAPSMEYKFPAAYGDSDWTVKPDETLLADWVQIIDVGVYDVGDLRNRAVRGYNHSYCLEVADNHNFFVLDSHKQYINVDNCTFRNCSAQQGMADMGVRPSQVGEVILNLRTYPIRVGNNYDADGNEVGNSGGWWHDQKELTWEQVLASAMGEAPSSDAVRELMERERTTVTKKVRRVATFSFDWLKYAAAFNGATALAVNFTHYLPGAWSTLGMRGGPEEFARMPDSVKRFVYECEEATGLPVIMLGTGPMHEDVIWRV